MPASVQAAIASVLRLTPRALTSTVSRWSNGAWMRVSPRTVTTSRSLYFATKLPYSSTMR
jgi:hypothetical protein